MVTHRNNDTLNDKKVINYLSKLVIHSECYWTITSLKTVWLRLEIQINEQITATFQGLIKISYKNKTFTIILKYIKFNLIQLI